MTRDEAINQLKEFIILHREQHGWDVRTLKALDMAIEALEQEPCKDAISRKAVIEHICESKDCYKKNCKGVLYNRCPDIEWVNELPPVTPQQKTGHWIIVDDCEKFIAKCSECGQIEDSRMISKYLYCPNCEAKMVEPQERSDKE